MNSDDKKPLKDSYQKEEDNDSPNEQDKSVPHPFDTLSCLIMPSPNRAENSIGLIPPINYGMNSLYEAQQYPTLYMENNIPFNMVNVNNPNYIVDQNGNVILLNGIQLNNVYPNHIIMPDNLSTYNPTFNHKIDMAEKNMYSQNSSKNSNSLNLFDNNALQQLFVSQSSLVSQLTNNVQSNKNYQSTNLSSDSYLNLLQQNVAMIGQMITANHELSSPNKNFTNNRSKSNNMIPGPYVPSLYNPKLNKNSKSGSYKNVQSGYVRKHIRRKYNYAGSTLLNSKKLNQVYVNKKFASLSSLDIPALVKLIHKAISFKLNQCEIITSNLQSLLTELFYLSSGYSALKIQTLVNNVIFDKGIPGPSTNIENTLKSFVDDHFKDMETTWKAACPPLDSSKNLYDTIQKQQLLRPSVIAFEPSTSQSPKIRRRRHQIFPRPDGTDRGRTPSPATKGRPDRVRIKNRRYFDNNVNHVGLSNYDEAVRSMEQNGDLTATDDGDESTPAQDGTQVRTTAPTRGSRGMRRSSHIILKRRPRGSSRLTITATAPIPRRPGNFNSGNKTTWYTRSRGSGRRRCLRGRTYHNNISRYRGSTFTGSATSDDDEGSEQLSMGTLDPEELEEFIKDYIPDEPSSPLPSQLYHNWELGDDGLVERIERRIKNETDVLAKIGTMKERGHWGHDNTENGSSAFPLSAFLDPSKVLDTPISTIATGLVTPDSDDLARLEPPTSPRSFSSSTLPDVINGLPRPTVSTLNDILNEDTEDGTNLVTTRPTDFLSRDQMEQELQLEQEPLNDPLTPATAPNNLASQSMGLPRITEINVSTRVRSFVISTEKCHENYLLEEMAWLSTDFSQEHKWKLSTARKISRGIQKYFEERILREDKVRLEEMNRLKKIASRVSKFIWRFWRTISRIADAKAKAIMEVQHQRHLDRQLNAIVGETEKYSDLISKQLSLPSASKSPHHGFRKGDSKVTIRQREQSSLDVRTRSSPKINTRRRSNIAPPSNNLSSALSPETLNPKSVVIKTTASLVKKNGGGSPNAYTNRLSRRSKEVNSDKRVCKDNGTISDGDVNQDIACPALGDIVKSVPGSRRLRKVAVVEITKLKSPKNTTSRPLTPSIPLGRRSTTSSPKTNHPKTLPKAGSGGTDIGSDGITRRSLRYNEPHDIGKISQVSKEPEPISSNCATYTASPTSEKNLLNGTEGGDKGPERVDCIATTISHGGRTLRSKASSMQFVESASVPLITGTVKSESGGTVRESVIKRTPPTNSTTLRNGEIRTMRRGEVVTETASSPPPVVITRRSSRRSTTESMATIANTVPITTILAKESGDDGHVTATPVVQSKEPELSPINVSLKDIKVEQSPTYNLTLVKDESSSLAHSTVEALKVEDTSLSVVSGPEEKLFDPSKSGGSSDRNDSNTEINDIAAEAEKFQPKGFTLATTEVCTKVPFLLKHQLREYQHIGLDWLVAMHNKNLNGILADEMGLGKTIQTISLLAHLACEKGVWGPHLIIVPTSVMLNWEMEFKKWCPGFRILTYFGSPKERRMKRKGWGISASHSTQAPNVVITSYRLVLQDERCFRRKRWYYFILDEAQNIKNFKSRRWLTLLNFKADHRLLLTGTPLQNDLMEVWSLMHFLMPRIFADRSEFSHWFVKPINDLLTAGSVQGSATEYHDASDILKGSSSTGNQQQQQAPSAAIGFFSGSQQQEAQVLVAKLHKILRPFILRRLKREVERQMPGKFEHVVPCRLSKRQRNLYHDFVTRASTRQILESGNLLGVVNALMQLRKVCNHPDLFEERPIVAPLITGSNILYQAPSPTTDILQRYGHHKSSLFKRSLFGYQGQERLRESPPRFNTEEHRDLRDNNNPLLNFVSLPGSHVHTGEFKTDAVRDIKYRAMCNLFSNLPCSPNLPNLIRSMTFSLPQSSSPSNGDRNGDQKNLEISPNNDVALVRTAIKGLFHFPSLYPSRLKQSNDEGQRLKDFLEFSDQTVFKPILRTSLDIYDANRITDRLVVRDTIQFLEALLPIIERFMIYIPPVSSGCPELHVSHPYVPLLQDRKAQEDFLIQKLRNGLSEVPLLRTITNARSLRFPEIRLIEYDCGKLQVLKKLLSRLYVDKHRVLIFTQMTKVLDILESFLNYHGYRYLRLDGSTKIEQRQIMMDRFNFDDKIFCFILSTRSGGLGINLTGADTVIFYDSDWNPTMDAQAQDRCHRIGQTREVHIYRLISQYTVEESILKKARQKKLLGDITIEEGKFTTAFFRRDGLKELFELDGSGDRANEYNVEEVTGANTTSADTVMEDLDKTIFGANVESATKIKNSLLEEAFEMAEDEVDSRAARLASRETPLAAEDIAEFDEEGTNGTIEPGNDGLKEGDIDNSSTQQENYMEKYVPDDLKAFISSLRPIERYSLRIYEHINRDELYRSNYDEMEHNDATTNLPDINVNSNNRVINDSHQMISESSVKAYDNSDSESTFGEDSNSSQGDSDEFGTLSFLPKSKKNVGQVQEDKVDSSPDIVSNPKKKRRRRCKGFRFSKLKRTKLIR